MPWLRDSASCILPVKAGNSDGRLKKLLKYLKILIGENIFSRDIILSYKFHNFEKAPSVMGKFLLL